MRSLHLGEVLAVLLEMFRGLDLGLQLTRGAPVLGADGEVVHELDRVEVPRVGVLLVPCQRGQTRVGKI